MEEFAITKKELEELGAPQVLIDLASGTAPPGLLAYELRPPRIFYQALRESPDRLPHNGQLIPLWETNGDSVTALVKTPSPSVIRYYFEDPPGEFEHIGSSLTDALQHVTNQLIIESGIDESRVLNALEAAALPNAAAMVASALALRAKE